MAPILCCWFLLQAPFVNPTNVDIFGDPLPVGAVQRLGSVRWRHGDPTWAVSYSRDGKIVASAGCDGFLRLWEGGTGKPLTAVPLSNVVKTDNPVWNAWLPDSARFTVVNDCATALSPDARWAAFTDRHLIVIWDIAAGKKKHMLIGHGYTVRDLAFAPDGQTLVSLSGDGTIRLWDVALGQEVRRLEPAPEIATSVVFAPDGQTVFVAEDGGTIHRYDPATGKEREPAWERDQGYRSTLAVSPDGKTLALAVTSDLEPDGPQLVLLDLPSGQPRATVAVTKNLGHRVTFSSDSTLVAVASSAWNGDKARLLVCASGTGKVQIEQAVRAAGRGFAVAFAPNGKTLLATGNTRLHRWNIADGTECKDFPGHAVQPLLVACSPDGKTIASSGGPGEVVLWHATTGQQLQLLRHKEDHPQSLAFSQDGQRLLIEGLRYFGVWDVAQDKVEWVEKFYPDGAALAPDGRTIADGGSGKIHLRKVGQRQVVRTLGDREDVAVCLAFSQDGRILASVGLDDTLRLWNMRSGKLLHALNHFVGSVGSMAFSPEGSALVRVQYHEAVLWEVWTGQLIGQWPTPNRDLVGAQFSPCGRWLVLLFHGGRIRVADLAADRMVGQLPAGVAAQAVSVGFFPNGKMVTGHSDGTLLVWARGLLAERPQRPGATLTAKHLDKLWADLIGNDAASAFRARWTLAASSNAVAFLRQRLLSAGFPDAQQLARYIADLDHPVYKVRDQAMRELEHLSEWAEGPLEKVLDGKPSLEMRQRVEKLLAKMLKRPLRADTIRALRAVAVLRAIGNAEAHAVLRELADDVAGAPATEAAEAALGRSIVAKE
jgi:WD40 repeat protein